MPKFLRLSALFVTLLFVSGFAECYKPVTKNQLARSHQDGCRARISDGTQALRYKIESRFTEAVVNELIHRGRGLRVQGEREGADAVIEGVHQEFQLRRRAARRQRPRANL